ncbi:ras and Rab interactor 1 [Chelonoidis abingdonii]|uniref:ras and Rab interactor 1 n=1 Tax=Chelonoidis abingdonii TaxID=106734 RepID=UPI003F499877
MLWPLVLGAPCPPHSSVSLPSLGCGPVYDVPDPHAFPQPRPARGSPNNVSLLDRLLLTQSVWLQLSLNSATALHILQREPPGTFLVRQSNTRRCRVLCLRLQDDLAPAFVASYCLQERAAGISLEGSSWSFPDLLHLVAFYCLSRHHGCMWPSGTFLVATASWALVLPMPPASPTARTAPPDPPYVPATSLPAPTHLSPLPPDGSYGADEFLPFLSFLLAQCDLPQLLMEAEYMMELMEPSQLLGEGGYYLTTLQASLALLGHFHEEEPRELRPDVQRALSWQHQSQSGRPPGSPCQDPQPEKTKAPCSGCHSTTPALGAQGTAEQLQGHPTDNSLPLHPEGHHQPQEHLAQHRHSREMRPGLGPPHRLLREGAIDLDEPL